jgi:hypothetical protein
MTLSITTLGKKIFSITTLGKLTLSITTHDEMTVSKTAISIKTQHKNKKGDTQDI